MLELCIDNHFSGIREREWRERKKLQEEQSDDDYTSEEEDEEESLAIEAPPPPPEGQNYVPGVDLENRAGMDNRASHDPVPVPPGLNMV